MAGMSNFWAPTDDRAAGVTAQDITQWEADHGVRLPAKLAQASGEPMHCVAPPAKHFGRNLAQPLVKSTVIELQPSPAINPAIPMSS
jgi:hypothetical protein